MGGASFTSLENSTTRATSRRAKPVDKESSNGKDPSLIAIKGSSRKTSQTGMAFIRITNLSSMESGSKENR